MSRQLSCRDIWKIMTWCDDKIQDHYGDVIMSTIASQITSLTIVYSTVYWGSDQRKHQSSASLAFVRGVHRWPVNSPHKWPVTRKMFPFDDVIMSCCSEDCSVAPVHQDVSQTMFKNINLFIFTFSALPYQFSTRLLKQHNNTSWTFNTVIKNNIQKKWWVLM